MKRDILLQVFTKTNWIALIGLILAPLLVTGCTSTTGSKGLVSQSVSKGNKGKSRSYGYPLTERACLERAMFFEANRSSREGLIAVGTVVMNRVNSSHYPKTICGVVGQKSQFAPGVLTRPMNSKALSDVREAADAVLRGERHPKLRNAMFFHTAGLKFPYRNMHYTLVAGGNAFYEKRGRSGELQVAVNDQPYSAAYAYAQEKNGKTPLFEKVIKSDPVIASVASTEKPRAEETGATPDNIPVPTPSPAAHVNAAMVALGYAAPGKKNEDIDVIGTLLRKTVND